MGMVALTYKVMPDSDVDDVSADDIATQIQALKDDVYDVQLCETKPLAFGLKFIQVHVVIFIIASRIIKYIHDIKNIQSHSSCPNESWY